MLLIIIYFILYAIILFAYVVYYTKLHQKLMRILETQSAKDFDLFASIHSLIFMIYSVIFIVYNIVFLVVFLNKYGSNWIIILSDAAIFFPLLLILTYTGFKEKKRILKKYKSVYGNDLVFYGQVRYISLFRHTCIISDAVLVIIIFSIIL